MLTTDIFELDSDDLIDFLNKESTDLVPQLIDLLRDEKGWCLGRVLWSLQILLARPLDTEVVRRLINECYRIITTTDNPESQSNAFQTLHVAFRKISGALSVDELGKLRELFVSLSLVGCWPHTKTRANQILRDKTFWTILDQD